MVKWQKVAISVMKWRNEGVKRLPVGMQGSHTHKLDSKGRMVLPARFREELGQSVVATIGIERCVSVYPQAQWEAFLGRLEALSTGSNKSRNLRRIILASAHEMEVDGMGRILVPQQLRDYAGIGQEVSVNGNGDKVEIWDKASWESYRDSSWEDLRELAEGVEGI